MVKLEGAIVKVKELLDSQKMRMFELMATYFNNLQENNFYRDLLEKQWIIVLKDSASGTIQGFSTQMLFETMVDGIKVKAVFSGDTIIDKKYWGERELARIGGIFLFSLMEANKDSRLFWFLVSMGYKTYRFLPVYFYDFYPRYDKATPEFEQKVLDSFAYQKFPLNYNPETGIIHFEQPKECLKSGVADLNDERLKDQHIRFFLKKNPSFNLGDELACIAEISLENMKPAFKKIFSGKKI